MAITDQKIKEIIINKLGAKSRQYLAEDKTVAELVTFLTGLTKAQIKTAIVSYLSAEKTATQDNATARIAEIDDTITEINAL